MVLAESVTPLLALRHLERVGIVGVRLDMAVPITAVDDLIAAAHDGMLLQVVVAHSKGRAICSLIASHVRIIKGTKGNNLTSIPDSNDHIGRFMPHSRIRRLRAV